MLPFSSPVKKARRRLYDKSTPLLIVFFLAVSLFVVFYFAFNISFYTDKKSPPTITKTTAVAPVKDVVTKNSRNVKTSRNYDWRKRNTKLNCLRSSNDPPEISVVILTYKDSEMLSTLLDSICATPTESSLEIIVADNGCFTETKVLLDRYGASSSASSFLKYLPICANVPFAEANNRASRIASNSSQWLLFLNDDVLPLSGFFQNFKVIIRVTKTCRD